MDPDGNPQSSDGATAMLYPQRGHKSLCTITRWFISLLEESEDGTLDLKDAIKFLANGQKRRIYDITNVLEGTGLVTKISKSLIKKKGSLASSLTLNNRMMELRSELKDLEWKERMLDQQKFWVEQSIRNTTQECSNLTYVNHEDVCNCFNGRTVLAVRAPTGTQLDIPIPKAVQNCPAKYQVYLKSINGPIDVMLLNKCSVTSSPVVLPVPPPDDFLQKAKLAMPTPDKTDCCIPPCHTSAKANHRTRLGLRVLEEMKSLSFQNAETNRADGSKLRNISKELEDLIQPTKEIMRPDLIKQLLASEDFSPIFRPCPPPFKQEYVHNLEESKGFSDTPVINV